MRKLRIKHPIVYCIIACVLWFLAQSLFGVLGAVIEYRVLPMNGQIMQLTGEAGSALIAFLMIKWAKRGSLLSEKGIGLGNGMKYGLVVILLAVVMSVLSIDRSKMQLNPLPVILVFLIYMLTVGMAEDFLYRGVMAESLLEHFGTSRAGVQKAAVISSLIFALTHYMNLTTGASFLGVSLQVLNAFLAGLTLAVIYFRTGNIWTVVIIHAIWDFFSLLQSANGLFVSSTSFAETLSGGVDYTAFVAMGVLLAFSVFMLTRKELYEAAAIFFDPYVKMQEEEKKQF